VRGRRPRAGLPLDESSPAWRRLGRARSVDAALGSVVRDVCAPRPYVAAAAGLCFSSFFASPLGGGGGARSRVVVGHFDGERGTMWAPCALGGRRVDRGRRVAHQYRDG